MLTPRRIVMAARLVFVMASLGMAVLMWVRSRGWNRCSA